MISCFLLGQQGEDAFAGAGDDVGGDEFAQAFHTRLAGVDGCAHRGDIAFDEDGDVAAAKLLARQHLDVGGLQRGVDGLEGGGKAVGFDNLDFRWLKMQSIWNQRVIGIGTTAV